MKSEQSEKSVANYSHTAANDTPGKKGIALPAVPVLQNKLMLQKVSEENEEDLLHDKFPKQLKERETVLQSRFVLQKKELEEEKLAVQRRFTVQRKTSEKEEQFSQSKVISSENTQQPELTVQRLTLQNQTIQKKENKTGLPDNLKEGVENLSGIAMDDARVHFNSAKPAQLNALAYAQGTDIHVGAGQEKHLPHEAWHIVQQKQGRVKPTLQLKEGVAVNDDKGLESEADMMGGKAISLGPSFSMQPINPVKKEKYTLKKDLHQLLTNRNTLLNNTFNFSQTSDTVQLVSLKTIAEDLVADSENRKTNINYQNLIVKLRQLQASEKFAATSGDYTSLKNEVENVRTQINNVMSTHGNRAKRNRRNTALNDLDVKLKEKITEYETFIQADVAVPELQLPKAAGPKAGFEMEFSNVLLLDIDKATQHQKLVLNGEKEKPSKKDWLQNASYKKRFVVFTSPHGTWKATADTTLSVCSNLEIVTEPFSKSDLANDPNGALAEDQQVLNAFISSLKDAQSKKLLFPAILNSKIQLNQAGARLYKLDGDSSAQTQMTAAIAVEKNKDSIPKWWIDGLNWDALPFLQRIKNGLETTTLHGQSNPKSGAFMLEDKNVILKTPISSLLGIPTQMDDLSKEQKNTWVVSLAIVLGVDLNTKVGKGLVQTTNKPSVRFTFHIQPTGFTWKQYLIGLLSGEDLVTTWAKTAFSVGDEDIGLGQINDDTLGQNFVVEEYRQFGGENSTDYLKYGRDWALKGKVPVTPIN